MNHLRTVGFIRCKSFSKWLVKDAVPKITPLFRG
ncbi:hypothetical protein J2S09_000643 [Bacillus fengqiuensis]|nr:hypothetical protein [Bacillus fengqiuensis]